VKIGLQIPNFTWEGGPAALGPKLAEIAKRAEEVGFHSVWVMDHFFQIEFVGPPEMDMLEGYTTLGYLAGCTSRVKLGTMVTGVTYRHPGILAKTVTTLDVLSGGRAWLGIGAGWFEREHLGLGVPFPSTAERFERLEETLQICLQMWSGKVAPYHGKHFQLAETLCVPAPVSKPHPPILIGGMGEKKTLRMVAQYAQGCNLFEFAGPEAIGGKLKVLKQHCQELGTDYGKIHKTTLGLFDFGNGYTERVKTLADLGIDEHIASFKDPTDPKAFDEAAKLIAAVA